jgi:pimeloyl-ACP methyl ester carboxylesterase
VIENARHLVAVGGRRLVGREYGPRDGRPVLFIAGAGSGSSMAFASDEALSAAGVRLLTMDRPGMGESTPDPERTLASTASDYRTYTEHVLKRADRPIPVVANSQGAVFGLACALDGWVSQLVLVSPADEVAFPQIRALMPTDAAGLSDLASTDPSAAARVLAGFDAQKLERMVLDSATASDRDVYTSPVFRETYRRALREGFAHAGIGYVHDTLIAMRPWGLPLGDIRSPVDVLFGEHDVGHSPDKGETLTRRIPDARRELLSDAGGALLWTHAQRVLAAAVRRGTADDEREHDVD